MTSPRLIFEPTVDFLQSEIQSVFHSIRKSTVNPNLCAIISPRGEKCGLAVSGFVHVLGASQTVQYQQERIAVSVSTDTQGLLLESRMAVQLCR